MEDGYTIKQVNEMLVPFILIAVAVMFLMLVTFRINPHQESDDQDQIDYLSRWSEANRMTIVSNESEKDNS